MKRVNIGISVAALTMTFLGFPTACSAGTLFGPITNPTNGHDYYLLEQATWTIPGFFESEFESRTVYGGHLVTINDQAENDWIFNTFSPLLLLSDPHPIIGLGLNDIATEGNHVWTSSEAPGYFNWDPNHLHFYPQPDGVLDDLVGMVTADPTFWTPGTWHDFYSAGEGALPDLVVYPLVEVTAVPAPSSLATLLGVGIVVVGMEWWKRRRHARR